jgi:hypothetical protein
VWILENSQESIMDYSEGKWGFRIKIMLYNVSNFRRIKNHKMLIQAFSKFLVDYHPVSFANRAGIPKDPENTEEESGARQKLEIRKKREIFGYRDDVSKILAGLDLFC